MIYPLNNTRFGGGTVKDLEIKSNQLTEFNFPFTLNYTDAIDPNGAILDDITSKCITNKATNLQLQYKISVTQFHSCSFIVFLTFVVITTAGLQSYSYSYKADN